MFIPDPDLTFSPIPDPGVKKAPDPGSGSSTLKPRNRNYILRLRLLNFKKLIFKVWSRGLEPEPKFGFAAPWSRSRKNKKYCRLRNTGCRYGSDRIRIWNFLDLVGSGFRLIFLDQDPNLTSVHKRMILIRCDSFRIHNDS
jgi:hypothetical protein